MFYCQHCEQLVERGQPINKVVVSYREKTYENQVTTRKQEKELNLAHGEFFTTHGREIEKEINTCPKCCIALTGRKPKLRKETNPQYEHPKRKHFTKKYRPIEQKQQHRRPEVSIVNKLPIIK